MLRTITWMALLWTIAPASASPSPFGAFVVDVPARGFEEHCLRLEAGEGVRYRFRATGEVEFNIHYHRGNDVRYPVRTIASLTADALFTASEGDDYCLMWERKGDGPVRIEGSIDRAGP